VKENEIAGVMGRIPERAEPQAIMKQLHISKKTQKSVSVSLQINKSLRAGLSIEVFRNKR
jgi:F0F1-type ATP synthase delta subunit